MTKKKPGRVTFILPWVLYDDLKRLANEWGKGWGVNRVAKYLLEIELDRRYEQERTKRMFQNMSNGQEET